MDNIIKSISAFILAIVVAINAFGNFIGIGDIIPTEPETTIVETTVPEETTNALDEEAISDFIAFYNAETAKIVANGSYSYNRNCVYTDPIDVGSATGIINGIITAIDENWSLDQAVGYFLGIGTEEGTHPEDYLRKAYRIKASALKEGDFKSFSEENGVYKFTLADVSNPKKTGETPLSRFTNDFVTHEEVVHDIAEITDAFEVTGTNAEYTDINVVVTVIDGKIASISYSYDMDAEVDLKAAGVTIHGTGAIRTTGKYTNIAY